MLQSMHRVQSAEESSASTTTGARSGACFENSLKCATLTAPNTLRRRSREVTGFIHARCSCMPACAAQFRATSYFCLISIQRHGSPGKTAREVARLAGMPQSFPVSQLHPCSSLPGAARTTLVANTTKRAQFLHSVQNAEASPLSLLALCLPVLTLVCPLPPLPLAGSQFNLLLPIYAVVEFAEFIV